MKTIVEFYPVKEQKKERKGTIFRKKCIEEWKDEVNTLHNQMKELNLNYMTEWECEENQWNHCEFNLINIYFILKTI